MRKVISLLAVFLLAGGLVVFNRGITAAHQVPPPCDFMTGGGFVITGTAGGFPNPTRLNFGAHGGCKKEDAARTSATLPNGQTVTQPGGFFWGNVNYLDHQLTPAFHMHGDPKLVIGYLCSTPSGNPCPTPPERETCGFGVIDTGGTVTSDSGTSTWSDGEVVLYRWAGRDVDEPGAHKDQFGITIRHQMNGSVFGSEEYMLRTGGPGGARTLEGGNIQYHGPNPSTKTGQTGNDLLCRGVESPDF